MFIELLEGEFIEEFRTQFWTGHSTQELKVVEVHATKHRSGACLAKGNQLLHHKTIKTIRPSEATLDFNNAAPT